MEIQPCVERSEEGRKKLSRILTQLSLECQFERKWLSCEPTGGGEKLSQASELNKCCEQVNVKRDKNFLSFSLFVFVLNVTFLPKAVCLCVKKCFSLFLLLLVLHSDRSLNSVSLPPSAARAQCVRARARRSGEKQRMITNTWKMGWETRKEKKKKTSKTRKNPMPKDTPAKKPLPHDPAVSPSVFVFVYLPHSSRTFFWRCMKEKNSVDKKENQRTAAFRTVSCLF